MRFKIRTFSGGLNTLFDQRALAPIQEGEPAETPNCENIEITSRGSIVSSTGFELVSEISATGGVKLLLPYEKNTTDKYLIIAHDDDYYYITPSSSVWTSFGDYGTAATSVGGVIYKGSSSIRRAILGTSETANLVSKWDGTTFQGLYSADGTFTVTIASPAVFTQTNHGLSAGDTVYFTTTGALPTGLTANTIYYVIAAGLTANAFEVSTTLGGAAVNTSGSQSGTHTLYTQQAIPDGWIMESFQGRLFIAVGSTLYYTDIENEDGFGAGGTISFDDIITGLKADQEVLQVHTSRTSYLVQFYYNDSFSLSAPLKKPFKNSSGCLAHKTIVSVYNDTYHLSRDGIQKFGADPNFINNVLRTNALSWKINPSLLQAKLNMSNIGNSVGVFYNKKALFSVPYGNDTFNSQTFQYNWDYDAWTVRTGFYPSGYAVFPDSSNRDQLYFSSALSPQLFKFGTFWSYNGAGYTKTWKSKVFDFGDPLVQKQFNFIDITGAIFENTILYVDIDVDGTVVTYKIDSSNLLTSSSGGYYGDDFLGDMYYGGSAENPFYRFGARCYLPISITQGRELQFTLRNNAAGQPWSVDYVGIDLDGLDEIQIPNAAVDELTS